MYTYGYLYIVGAVLRKYAERVIVEIADALAEEIRLQSGGEGSDQKVCICMYTCACRDE